MEDRLLSFLEKRGCRDRFDEIIMTTDGLSSGNGFYSYLPAVAYVILKDKYGMTISPSEVTSERVGQARFKFIQKTRRKLGIGRRPGIPRDEQVHHTIMSICNALSLSRPVYEQAWMINAAIPATRRRSVKELFYYCASLVCLAAVQTNDISSKREVAHCLDISHNFVRKYERFICQELGGADF